MNETSIVEVDLDDRSYPIYIGDTLLARKELFEPHIVGNQVMIVSNSTIAPIYQDFLIESYFYPHYVFYGALMGLHWALPPLR